MVLLRGAHAVRTLVIAFLAEAVPAMCDIAMDQWFTSMDYKFEVPEVFEPYEKDGMSGGSGPVVYLSVARSQGYGRVDFSPTAEEQYRPTYNVRVYTYTYTPDALEDVPQDAKYQTLRARDDLAAIVKSAILDRPSLGQPDLFEVLIHTLAEEYSEATTVPNNSGRYIAACITTFDLRVDESQFREALGQVPSTGVRVDAELMEGI